MRASRLTEVLNKLIRQEWAAFVWGPPGVGKSAIVREVAEAAGLPVVDLRASLLDPTDLRGIPMVKGGEAVWCPPAFLPKKNAKPGILFLDEINAAPPLVQAAMYQLVLDRRVGEYELPRGWKIIAAGNRAEDRAVTFRLSTALANRFIHLTLEPDAGCWADWALTHGINPIVLGFIRYRPELLYVKPEAVSQTAFATPRSWEMASDAIAAMGSVDAARDILPGIVGEGPAAELIAFAKTSASMKEINAAVSDPEHCAIPTKLDRLWALVSWFGTNAGTSSNVDRAISVLLGRLPPEFSVVLARDALKKNPRFIQNPGFLSFVKQHPGLIL